MKPKHKLIRIWLLCAAVLPGVTSGAQPVTRIAAGEMHSLFLKGDGSLWAMGDNEDGQLGDGTYSYPGTNRPEQILTCGVTAIAAGGSHNLFLKSDGSLWAMGDNAFNQLGDGSYNTYTNRPEQIVPGGVTAIAAGCLHSLFLKSDGSLWGMGGNCWGELGDGTYCAGTNRPKQSLASGVTAIAGGWGYSLFLKSDGSLWVTGYNAYGDLGDGTTNKTNLPEQIVASNVTAIAAGVRSYHSLFLKSDGSLWAMGGNDYGQLGDGTFNNTNQPEQIVASGVTAIAAGEAHSLFLKSDGSLWAMGLNVSGQLGDGTYSNTNQPEQIVAGGVTAIAAGKLHSLFLKSDGSLWGMGYNTYGQLGDGTTDNGHYKTNRPEQIVAGPPGYNRISTRLLSGGDVRLSYVGIAGTNYALDRRFTLSPANWVPQVTNPADANGVIMLTNTLDPTTNNFWRIRSVP